MFYEMDPPVKRYYAIPVILTSGSVHSSPSFRKEEKKRKENHYRTKTKPITKAHSLRKFSSHDSDTHAYVYTVHRQCHIN